MCEASFGTSNSNYSEQLMKHTQKVSWVKMLATAATILTSMFTLVLELTFVVKNPH